MVVSTELNYTYPTKTGHTDLTEEQRSEPNLIACMRKIDTQQTSFYCANLN